MRELNEWWDHVAGLLRDTVRAWWRTLPRLITAYVLGLAGFRLAVSTAPFFSDRHPWLSLFTLAVGLVCLLSGTIVCLRVLGHELGVRENLPEGAIDDDRDQSVARLLAITLLPFLGIYATFGRINEAAVEVFQYERVMHGTQGSALGRLNPTTWHQSLVVAGVMVGTYLLRRVVDVLHEKTDVRPLGLVAALLEGFFMLVLLETGSRLVVRGWLWMKGRLVAGWVLSLVEGFRASLGRIYSLLPAALDEAWHFLAGTVWPLFTGALLEPLLWLAVAALVYGSHVLSLAEMWRKGEPLSAHLDAQRTIALRRSRRREAAVGHRGRRVLLEVQEAFFGDVDDKYLPTLQSVRLVLRMGVTFLGAYVLCYSLAQAVTDGLVAVLNARLGGHDQNFWLQWSPLVEAAALVVGEPLRLSLLAVAFARILQVLRSEADPSALAAPTQGQGDDPVGYGELASVVPASEVAR